MNSVTTIVSTILQHAYTRVEAEKLLSLFRMICEAHFYQQADSKTIEALVIERFKNVSDSGYFFEALPELMELAHTSSKGRIYELVHDVSEALELLPVLTLYIPTRLEHGQIQRIGTWARTQIAEQLLLQCIINPDYRGGCGISWKGIMKDYSFNHFLNRESRSIESLIQNA
ncbi:hypothetical protein HY469_00240 [Candidatus Roizmanbacteria bacterium]|nr:hypothetical protein [Candidatus Roizmanbacteria bacterium]